MRNRPTEKPLLPRSTAAQLRSRHTAKQHERKLPQDVISKRECAAALSRSIDRRIVALACIG